MMTADIDTTLLQASVRPFEGYSEFDDERLTNAYYAMESLAEDFDALRRKHQGQVDRGDLPKDPKLNAKLAELAVSLEAERMRIEIVRRQRKVSRGSLVDVVA